MAPPSTATPGGEGSVAKENLDKARKLIDDLEKKGCQVTEARGWYDQANDMYRSGLYRTSIIYSSYALDAANETVQRIKDMVLKVTKVKARAVDQLGKDNKNMPRIDEMIAEMKTAINEGRLDDCQEMIGQVDEILRGGSSPYTDSKPVRTTAVKTVQPSRGYSSCPSCGNITESSWTECKYCGQDLKGESEEGGPAWTSGDGGPRMVSDEAPNPEEEQDLQSMERTEEEMDRVETDLQKTETEMVQETERSVDEKTSTDMEVQETVEQEREATEADLEKEKRNELIGNIQAWREKGYDISRLEQYTQGDLTVLEQEVDKYADNVDKLRGLTARYQKLTSPMAKKIEPFMMKPDEVPRLEKAIAKLEAKESAPPAQEKPTTPEPKPPMVEEKPVEEPPKPAPPVETPPVVEPVPSPPPVEAKPPEEPPKAEVLKVEPPKPEEPKPDGPKKFFIPPPPKLSFDDVPMPSLFAKKGQKKCPSCGKDVEADALTCPSCNADLMK